MLVNRRILEQAQPVDPKAKPETASLLGSPTVDESDFDTEISSSSDFTSSSTGGQSLIDAADKARQRLRR
jgi:hypothetical protein